MPHCPLHPPHSTQLHSPTPFLPILRDRHSSAWGCATLCPTTKDLGPPPSLRPLPSLGPLGTPPSLGPLGPPPSLGPLGSPPPLRPPSILQTLGNPSIPGTLGKPSIPQHLGSTQAGTLPGCRNKVRSGCGTSSQCTDIPRLPPLPALTGRPLLTLTSWLGQPPPLWGLPSWALRVSPVPLGSERFLHPFPALRQGSCGEPQEQ